MTRLSFRPADYPPGLLALPALDWMWTDALMSILALESALPPRSGVAVGRRSSSPAANRNDLVEGFLENHDWEWICFLDSDMVAPPVTVCRLLSHNQPIVGALCYARREPYLPCFRDLESSRTTSETGLREVDFVGTGCLLVQRRALEALQFPWFEHSKPGFGEDTLFCHKARDAGFPVYVDLELCVGHIGISVITRRGAIEFQQTPRGRQMVQALESTGSYEYSNET